MKAILLAGGLGTRLRPLTDTVPKCLVNVAGRPLLAWWFDLFDREGVTSVMINLHHLHKRVREYLDAYSGPVEIETIFEPTLLGSAGTLCATRSYVEGEERFYVLYGDNLTDVRLRDLLDHNRRYRSILTVGTFRAEDPTACGILETRDQDGRVVDFVEKPAEPTSDRASAGMFVAGPGFHEALAAIDRPEEGPFDFGRHVMPQWIGRMNAIELDGYIRDVGTFDSLERADREFRDRRIQQTDQENR